MDFLFQVKLRLLTHNKNVEAVLSMYEDVTVRVCNMFFPFLPYVMCFFSEQSTRILNRLLESKFSNQGHHFNSLAQANWD